MKKALSVLVVLAALVALVGCGTASTLTGTTWKESEGNLTITWEFGKDGFLTKTTTLETAIGVSSNSVKYEYTVSGDKLSIKDDEEYTVVKTVSSDKTYYLELKNSDGDIKKLYPVK